MECRTQQWLFSHHWVAFHCLFVRFLCVEITTHFFNLFLFILLMLVLKEIIRLCFDKSTSSNLFFSTEKAYHSMNNIFNKHIKRLHTFLNFVLNFLFVNLLVWMIKQLTVISTRRPVWFWRCVCLLDVDCPYQNKEGNCE